MRWRAITAVVRRDLTVALGSKAVVLPAVIVPLIFVVVFPLLAGLAPRLLGSGGAWTSDLAPLLDALPEAVRAGLPVDPVLQAAVLAVTYLMAPLVLIVPVMFAAVIAADGIAGEKERGSLEGLLLTPLSDRDLVTAKLLASLVPAVVLGIGSAVVYALVANLVLAPQVGGLVLPTAEYAVMTLWLGPAMAAASLGAVLLVSVRVSTAQEAFQIGGVVVLPVVGLVVTQSTGALLLSVWLLVAGGVVALALAAGLLAVGGRSLSRTRMGERLA
jgi:ABC-2 type transport system permease protein